MERSLAICEQMSDVYKFGECHKFLASFEAKQGNILVAMTPFRKALARFEQVHAPDAENARGR